MNVNLIQSSNQVVAVITPSHIWTQQGFADVRVGDFQSLQEMCKYREDCVGVLGTIVKEMDVRSNFKLFFVCWF